MMNPVSRWRYWFPAVPDRDRVAGQLASFYATSAEYHAMTRGGDKASHPQVGLLSSLARPGGVYAEVGCGGADVARLLGREARVIGMDVAEIALRHAVQDAKGLGGASLVCATADRLPLCTGSVDGAYSFEVLEHLWDPVQVVKEMLRITKPGGFVLISAPNHFSLDLHLNKRRATVAFDVVLAALRWVYDRLCGAPFVNIVPELDGKVYPDCDMIASIIPANFAAEVRRLGGKVVFWDTTYMCALRTGSNTGLNYQRRTGHVFWRHFGDHVLMLIRKANPMDHSASVT